MSKRSLMPDAVEEYVFRMISATRADAVVEKLRKETARLPEAGLQIGPDQAAFMAMLVRTTGARRALEIGTFTGYSALAVASALPEDGRLVCCDVSEEWTSIARRYWEEAGVEEKIDLRLGPARQTLEGMLQQGAADSFDFAFIDADKPAYDTYYELCLRLVRAGGLILLDNMLWHGAVTDPANHEQQTEVIRALNEKISGDKGVEATLLSIGDGIMMVRKGRY